MPAVPSSPRVKLRTTSRRVPRVRPAAASEAVDDSPEPTMRLSRALLVMLLLHIVAVGGFFASSVLKERDLRRKSGDSASVLEAEDSLVPVKGDAASAPKRVPATTNVRPHVHVVRPGETLTLIANENGVTLEALVAANGTDTVTNGLRTGQELKLPERSPDPASNPVGDSTTNALKMIEGRPKTASLVSAPTPSTANKPTRSTVPDSGKSYTVGKGESVYTIAQKNKVSAESLLKLNGIDDPKKLRPGQKLRLPTPPAKAKSKQP